MARSYSTHTHGNHTNSFRVQNDASFQEICLAPHIICSKGGKMLLMAFVNSIALSRGGLRSNTRHMREVLFRDPMKGGSLLDKVWWTLSWHNYYKRLMMGIIKSSCCRWQCNLSSVRLHAKSLVCINTTPDSCILYLISQEKVIAFWPRHSILLHNSIIIVYKSLLGLDICNHICSSYTYIQDRS